MNKIKSAYKTFFNWCHVSGRMAQDPACGLKMARSTVCATRCISSAEVNRLLDCIRDSPAVTAVQDEALFAAYAFTGARRSEVLSLRIGDFDSTGSALYFRAVKGGGARRQTIPDRLARILRRYLRSSEMTGCGKDDFMFVSTDGTPLSARAVQERFTNWKRRARISTCLTIHSFRAGYATTLHSATQDLILVSRMLGHRSIRTTERYICGVPPALKRHLNRAFPPL